MKQGKTLRLTSIVLALMMFFAMISVLLVPAGTAGAADENIYIDFEIGQDPAKLSADDYLPIPSAVSGNYNVIVTVTEDIWKDNRDFSQVLISFEQPNGVTQNALKGLSMTNVGEGKWQYTFTVNPQRMPGLWAVRVWRKDQTWEDTVPVVRGIFWLYDKGQKVGANGAEYLKDANANNQFSQFGEWAAAFTEDKGFIANASTKKNYAKLGAEVRYAVLLAGGQPQPGIAGTVRMIDRKTWTVLAEEKNGDGTGNTDIVVSGVMKIPTSYKHKDELDIVAFAVTDTYRSPNYCQILEVYNTQTQSNKIIIDAEGPAIGEMVLSHTDLVGKLVMDNKLFRYIARPNTQVTDSYKLEVNSIVDSEVGIGLTDPTNPASRPTIYYKFTNLYNGNIVYDKGNPANAIDLAAFDATFLGTYYSITANPNAKSRTIGNALLAILDDQQWKLEVVAEDALGNVSTKEYGRVMVYPYYDAIRDIRIEAENVVTMYKGQVLTKEEVLGQNVKVRTNTEPTLFPASFPDAWYFFVNAGDSAYLDYDPEAGTITALQAGEARLSASPFNIWTWEDLPGGLMTSATGRYIRVVISEEPVVKSLSLNNTTMTIDEGQTQKLTATVDPAAVKVLWETSDASIATVDQEGNVTGVKQGTAVIYAKAGHMTKQCVVTVKGETAATGITLNKSSMTLSAPNTETLFATLTPAGATTAISWNTSDASVATVDNAGKVTAVKNGKATITATAGTYSAKCEVTVADVEGPTNDGWGEKDGNKVYYVQGKLILGWRRIDGYWYYFAPENGYMRGKGWLKEGSKWYYLNSDGKMKEGEWYKEGGKWYWLKISTGAMAQSEWYKVNGVWYLFDDNGRMLTGWQKVRGIWYYMKSSGAMYEGWLQDGGVWYYLTPTGGAMVTGRVVIGGRASDFAASGRWLGYVK